MKCFFFLLLTSCCGYQSGIGNKNFCSSGINVPYIEGDREGLFTAELIYALKRSGLFAQKNKGYQLKVKIGKDFAQEIGWREDFKNTQDEKRVVVDEQRKGIVVEVTLCKGSKICFGPKKIRSFVDYDFFDPDSLQDLSFIIKGKRQTTLDFSLGQLTAQDNALTSAKSSLYRKMAEKIVDQIYLEW
jgi:hypothetical protein